MTDTEFEQNICRFAKSAFKDYKGSKRMKRLLTEQLTDDMITFHESHPDYTLERLEEHFHSQAAEDSVEKKNLRIKWIFIFLLAVLIGISVFWYCIEHISPDNGNIPVYNEKSVD